jgi:hypothetical protein
MACFNSIIIIRLLIIQKIIYYGHLIVDLYHDFLPADLFVALFNVLLVS